MNPVVVGTCLTDLLASAVAVLTDPPARRFVAHGAWANDCESVAVRLGDLSFEPLDNVNAATASVATFYVSVLRCHTTANDQGDPPDVATITAESVELAADFGALYEGLADRWAAGTLFPNVPTAGCFTVQFTGGRPIGPSDLAGWEVAVVVRS